MTPSWELRRCPRSGSCTSRTTASPPSRTGPSWRTAPAPQSEEEHRKHSPGCAFLTVKKQMEELTVSEFLKLDRQRAKNKIAKETNNKQKEFEETAKTTRQSIEQLAA